MKKFRFLTTVCAMAIAASITLTGCGKGDEKSDKKSDAGHYNLISMTDNGENITIKELQAMYEEMDMEAPEMYLDLNEDGTGKLVMGEEDTEVVEWKEGVITSNGDDVKYTIKDNELTMEDGNVKMVFEKE